MLYNSLCSGEDAHCFQEDHIASDEGSRVVVYGPPGTESRCQNDPFNRVKSVVYSRISAGAGLSPGHTPSSTQVLSIPPKDSPRVRGEVYTPVRLTHPKLYRR